MSVSQGGSTLNYNQLGFDAGSRTRVSQLTTLADLKILGADDTFLWENQGTGTGAYGSNKYNMSVASGQWLVRQTKRCFPYFSGKSQIMEVTFDNFQTEANVVKRAGYFSSNAVSPFDTTYDGFWIEDDGTTKRLRASRDGTSTLNVALADWNGKGYNWANHDWSKFNVVLFDFLWLGGAVLRMFVDTPFGFQLAHTYIHAASFTDTFILNPNQPIRYEIRSSTGSGSFRYICSQISTEGSVEESGKGLAVFNTTPISAGSVGTYYALLGLKKQTAYRCGFTQILDISVANTASTDAGIMVLIINPTLSAPLTYGNNSKIQVAVATNQTITAGTGRIIAAKPITANGGDTEVMKSNFLGSLSSTLDNTHDEFVLGYIPTTTNQSVNGVINIKEY